jgi:hypothetical protein
MGLTGHHHDWTVAFDEVIREEVHSCPCGASVTELEILGEEGSDDSVGYRRAREIAALKAARRRGIPA